MEKFIQDMIDRRINKDNSPKTGKIYVARVPGKTIVLKPRTVINTNS